MCDASRISVISCTYFATDMKAVMVLLTLHRGHRVEGLTLSSSWLTRQQRSRCPGRRSSWGIFTQIAINLASEIDGVALFGALSSSTKLRSHYFSKLQSDCAHCSCRSSWSLPSTTKAAL